MAILPILRWPDPRLAQRCGAAVPGPDLDRLAQVGAYMLRDIGLDPNEPRPDASAILDRPRRPPIA